MRLPAQVKSSRFRVLLIPALLVGGCVEAPPVETQLSALTMWSYSPEALQPWLESPQYAFVEAWFCFPDDLSEDVYFGLDLELFEGLDSPRHFPGADWMAFVCLNRNGRLGFPDGSQADLAGIESHAENWTFLTLDQALDPNVWYQLRVDVDYGERRFTQVSVTGPHGEQRLDLSAYALCYPNYVPVGPAALTFYTFSTRWQEKESGSTIVFIDDVRGGVYTDESLLLLVDDGFETTEEILFLPYPDAEPWWPKGLEEGKWYFENYRALAAVVGHPTRSGQQALATDAKLSQ